LLTSFRYPQFQFSLPLHLCHPSNTTPKNLRMFQNLFCSLHKYLLFRLLRMYENYLDASFSTARLISWHIRELTPRYFIMHVSCFIRLRHTIKPLPTNKLRVPNPSKEVFSGRQPSRMNHLQSSDHTASHAKRQRS